MEVIAANRGISYVDQPLSVYTASAIQLQYLPIVELGEIISLDGDQDEQLRKYLELLLSGRLRVNAPWRIWRQEFDFVSERLILKILTAKPLIDWVDQNFHVHIIYTTRHPIAVALSVIRNGWGLTSRAFLNNHQFIERYLDDDKVAFCWDVLQRGSLLQKHVLNWGLENLVPLRLLPERPRWLYCSYERAVTEPQETTELLASKLGIRDRARMDRQMRLPSRSTRFLSTRQSRDAMQGPRGKEKARFLVQRWKQDVSDAEERDALKVLDKLDLAVYEAGRFEPLI
jgi:hypothetical protein